MNDIDLDKNESAGHIDIKVGAERNNSKPEDYETNYLLEEILKTVKEQNENVKQIKYIAFFFFWISLIVLTVGFVGRFY